MWLAEILSIVWRCIFLVTLSGSGAAGACPMVNLLCRFLTTAIGFSCLRGSTEKRAVPIEWHWIFNVALLHGQLMQ